MVVAEHPVYIILKGAKNSIPQMHNATVRVYANISERKYSTFK